MRIGGEEMHCYTILLLVCAAICLLAFAALAIRLVAMGKPKDLSQKGGSVTKGVIYSSIPAMMPQNKESAYMHLPTYAAGIIYHIGTFVMLLYFMLYVVSLFVSFALPEIVNTILVALISLSALCGIGMVLKRVFNRDLRVLSIPDDYISNILTTAAQIATVLLILGLKCSEVTYCIMLSLLFLWLPVGKTKHLLYFFFARFHLGYFYGWRGSWPVKN